MSDSANKRIAKNTIWMYFRLFMTMFIGLYTSRIVLLILGVSDYGLFSVVGGVLAMFTFISGSLSGACARFLNVEMGKPDGDVNRCYNINLFLHLALAAIIFVLAETVGIWYIYNHLNVEQGKMDDALFVYQVSIITACLGIINGPCASLFSAYERFAFLATFDIINTLLRFGCILLLQFYDGNALRLYCIIMSITTINTFVVFHWIAKRDWPQIIKYRFIFGWKNYKEVLAFSNWNLAFTLALMARSTGCDLIMNAFFGTAINGAFAVSKTVNNYITSFSTNFDSASGPQIIQSFSAGDYARSNYLVNKLGRFCLLLFEVMFFPLYIELDFVLHLWLKEVPEGVLTFTQLNLLLAAVALTCGGIAQIINASGKIKWFKLTAGFYFLLCIPLGIVVYKLDAPAYTMIILFIIADTATRITQLILLKKILSFDSIGYVKAAYTKPFIIALLMSCLLLLHSAIGICAVWFRVLSIIGCFFLVCIFVYTIGLTMGERKKFIQFITKKVRRI